MQAAQPASKTDSQSNSQTVSQSDDQSVSQIDSEPDSLSAGKTVSQTDSQLNSRPASKSDNKSESQSRSQTVSQTAKRIIYLDILRAIAIISITFNHAVNRSFAVYSRQLSEFQSLPFYMTAVKSGLYAFSRIGVPLFVMITGALLLTRKYDGGLKEGSISRFIKHNWLSLFITTEIWLAIMFWFLQFSNPESILYTKGLQYTLFRFVLTLLFINPITMGSMWYMDMILCMYLLIPIIAIAVKQIDGKYFLIPAAIVVFCSYILPDLNGTIKALGIDFSVKTKLESANIFSMYVVYLLLGYYISKGALAKISSKALWLALSAGSLGFCAFQIWFYSLKYNFVVGKEYRSIFPMIIAVALFELARRYKDGTAELLEKMVTKLSVISFGIYFVHICVMEGIKPLVGPNIKYLSKFALLESVSFFGAIVIIYLLSRSKILGKYLFNIK
ncbi:MAG: acyltransferase [bacterium]|nr:acyltransferase [bacterium]